MNTTRHDFLPLLLRPLASAAAVASLLLSSQALMAHPYASGITNNAGSISFVLNENADNVLVIFDGGGLGNTNNLGALSRGVNSFSLGSHTSYSIVVSKAGTGTPSQISPTPAAGTSSTNLDFNGPRGVAINRNPKDHNFGRIYVANASGGNHLRPVGRGIYIFNADYSDCLGRGTNASHAQANFPNSGSQWWGGSTTYGPYRIWVGPDDTLYVGDSSGVGSLAGCPVWMMDPDVTTPVEMFSYVGATGGNSGNMGPCQTKPVVTGSLSGGDLALTCMAWNYLPTGGTYQSVLRYNIGAGPIDSSTVWTGLPDIAVTNSQPGFGAGGINGVGADLVVGPNGYIYVSFGRSNGGGIASGNNELWVYDNSIPAKLLWASSDPATGGVGTGGTNDCFQTKGIAPLGSAISSDGQYLGFGNALAANFCIVKLTNGIPDPSTIATYPAAATPNRSVAFDIADNFYTVEGNSDSLRGYSLGLTTTAITSNDWTTTNGTFQLVLPPTTVTVVASTPNASQGHGTPVPGVFTITRQGQLNQPLVVGFSLAGTATNGTYTVSGASSTTNVTLAAGVASTNVTITPVNDNVPRLTTTVTLSLASGTNYSAVAPVSASIAIQNTAEPQLVISAAAATCYKRYTSDFASISVTRLGDTNTTFPISTLTFGGTAVQGTDYTVLGTPSLPAGVITATFPVISPLNPPEPTYVGNKTVVVSTGNNGSTYTSAGTATLTILDDAYPPATVLFSDPLTNNVDGDNNDGSASWNLTWVNRDVQDNPYPDYSVDWGYDLVNDPNGYGHIPLPPSGFSSALRASYNKIHGGLSGAVNLYPTNMTFSGNYAVRFSMYLVQGSALGTATEGVLFGIDHDGMETNWWAGSTPVVGGPWSSDGVWYWIDADAGGAAAGDYLEKTGVTNAIPNTGWLGGLPTASWASFTNVFKPNLFTTLNGATNSYIGGLPANGSPAIVTTNPGNWADVEIRQVNNLVTLSINKTPILTYQNTNSLFQSGVPMLGYEDPFDSTGNLDAGVYFSNLQVVRLVGVDSLTITSAALSGGNMVLTFTSTDGTDTPASFAVQSSSVVNGTYADVTPAAGISQNGAVFTAVVPQNGPVQFYRIRHK